MKTETRRPGRPRTRDDAPPRLGAYIGLRASDDLKEKLVAAANRDNRSISAETAFLLEKSFDYVELLDAVLGLAFGEQNAAAVLAFGRILRDQSMFAAYGGPPDWQSDDNQCATILLALRTWIERQFLRNLDPAVAKPDEERADRFATVASMDSRVCRALDMNRSATDAASDDGGEE